MTAQGGDHGEEYRAHADQPQPLGAVPTSTGRPAGAGELSGVRAAISSRRHPQPPYPSQPPPGPPYGYPAPPPGGPLGYGGPPPYPGPYDPYQGYQASSYRTNGLAMASLTTSIVGIPLSFLCYLGLPLAIAGIVLGIVSLSQVNRTPQQGRGLAIAGIAIGSVTVTLLLASIAVLAAHHPTFIGG